MQFPTSLSSSLVSMLLSVIFLYRSSHWSTVYVHVRGKPAIMADTASSRQSALTEACLIPRNGEKEQEKEANLANFDNLPRKSLLYVLVFLPIQDIITVTGACKSLAKVQFPKEFLDYYQLQASFPLNSGKEFLSRLDLLDCLRKTSLFRLKAGKIHFDSLVGSDLLPILISVSAKNRVFFFSQRADSVLTQWELLNTRPVILRLIPCDGKVLDIQLKPGKLGLICTKTSIIVHNFPWEIADSAQIQTFSFNLREETKSGSLYFFDQSRQIAAILNSWIYVFSGKLELLRSFRDTNWVNFPGWSLQVSPDLPYLALICMREVLIYDITLARKLPVFQYEIPFVEQYKAKSVLVSCGERRKGYIVLQVRREGSPSVLLGNSKLIAKETADFSLCQNCLFVCRKDSNQIDQYEVSLSGIIPTSTISITDSLTSSSLITYESHLILIGQRSGFPGSTLIAFYDYQGWRYYSVKLSNFEVDRAVPEGSSGVVLTGECAYNHVKIALLLNYRRTNLDPLRLKDRARLGKESEQQKAKSSSKAVRADECIFRLRREGKRREQQAKVERAAAMKSRFWKNSERKSREMDNLLLEDFPLL